MAHPRLRVNDGLKRSLGQDDPEGCIAMQEATNRLGVTRQTVLHHVQRGELDAVLICRGRQKRLAPQVVGRSTYVIRRGITNQGAFWRPIQEALDVRDRDPTRVRLLVKNLDMASVDEARLYCSPAMDQFDDPDWPDRVAF